MHSDFSLKNTAAVLALWKVLRTSAGGLYCCTVVERSQHIYARHEMYIQHVYCTSMHSNQVLCAYSLHSHIAKPLYPAVCTRHDSSLRTMAPTGCCVPSAQQLIMLPCRVFATALASADPRFAPVSSPAGYSRARTTHLLLQPRLVSTATLQSAEGPQPSHVSAADGLQS